MQFIIAECIPYLLPTGSQSVSQLVSQFIWFTDHTHTHMCTQRRLINAHKHKPEIYRTFCTDFSHSFVVVIVVIKNDLHWMLYKYFLPYLNSLVKWAAFDVIVLILISLYALYCTLQQFSNLLLLFVLFNWVILLPRQKCLIVINHLHVSEYLR